ncbi:hypothetical protein [Pseudomonas sp. HMWF021]|jgi:hypothetical protein|uniref:hypothetical protein n=1 Tax=Pseudomonas sp. HMWF021 TaxID=2056857 RepID=UPI000D343B67|nr:hypothetical protein [Pseudomonas sp. HMWF021]PTT30053.1 hypothetical protein DBR18_11245 [Pseudomonas sp. HMWF021]
MEFLCLLAFLAAWGFMWRWVVKNRGNWNLFIGNVLGAGSGFIVGIVVFSITLSLFAPQSKTAKRHSADTATQEAAPAAMMPEPEREAVPTPAPVTVVTPARSPDDFPAYVAGKPRNEPSPPDSALLPNYRGRLADSLSEKTRQDEFGEAFSSLRNQVSKEPDADQSLIASVMCVPFVQKVMRFPASTEISDTAPSSERFKDQTYTISNRVTSRNMLGDDVTYRFDCTMQRVAAKNLDDADWRLLDLKLQKVGS